ncbi:endonuclease [Rhodobacterales bacterium HKCCE2091]|nr:endonuclease [Rhodobacterales bacterium HKCCE2091]
MKIVARRVLLVIAAGLVLAIVAGYGGALHPALVSISLGRHLAATALIPVALFLLALGAKRGGIAALAVAAFAGLPIFLGLINGGTTPEGPSISVHSRNLLAVNRRVEALAREIVATDSGVVFLQELSPANMGLLDALAPSYPTQHFCPFSRWNGVAVLSRLPGTGESFCSETRGFAGLRVETETGPVWVVSVHLVWPWPYRQQAVVDRELPRLAALERPVILGGDFNAAPWSRPVRQIEEVTGTRRAGPIRYTIAPHGVPLPIDMVLGPGGGLMERRPGVGSDHRGLVARLALAP